MVENNERDKAKSILLEFIEDSIYQGSAVVKLFGSSMSPWIPSEAYLTFSKIHDPKELNIGDIVMFPSFKGDVLVAHRIIWKMGDRIFTKGDYNFSFDLSLDYKDIKGKLVSIYHSDIKIHMDRGLWKFSNWVAAKLSVYSSILLKCIFLHEQHYHFLIRFVFRIFYRVIYFLNQAHIKTHNIRE